MNPPSDNSSLIMLPSSDHRTTLISIDQPRWNKDPTSLLCLTRGPIAEAASHSKFCKTLWLSQHAGLWEKHFSTQLLKISTEYPLASTRLHVHQTMVSKQCQVHYPHLQGGYDTSSVSLVPAWVRGDIICMHWLQWYSGVLYFDRMWWHNKN